MKKEKTKNGTGIEVTQGKGDTKGFPLRSEAAIVQDLRGFYRLELPRENRRTVQSSNWFVQGWQANSDIQILLYDCNPCTPNPEEIARVTDYVVAYQYKVLIPVRLRTLDRRSARTRTRIY